MALSSPLQLLLASREPRYDAPLPGKAGRPRTSRSGRNVTRKSWQDTQKSETVGQRFFFHPLMVSETSSPSLPLLHLWPAGCGDGGAAPLAGGGRVVGRWRGRPLRGEKHSLWAPLEAVVGRFSFFASILAVTSKWPFPHKEPSHSELGSGGKVDPAGNPTNG